VQRTLRAARAAGLLDGTDLGPRRLTGRGVTEIAIHADHRGRSIPISAEPNPAGDRGLTSAPRRAGRAVRRFAHGVLEPSFDRRVHGVHAAA
jgi:hypothetical protein